MPEIDEISASSAPVGLSESELRALTLFAHLDDGELAWLARRAELVRVDADELVVREGAQAAAFYIVRDGAVAVFRDAVGVPVQLLARLRHGEHFGELALFSGGAFAASVRATEPTTLVRIATADFQPFMARHPRIQLQLQASAARRHTRNVASMLELGRRREVRIRCGRELQMRLEGVDEPISVRLENLSLGGLCLSGAPADWSPARRVRFGLCVREGVLELEGDVAWRGGDTVGLCFVKKSANHDMIVQMAIRLIVESAA